MNLKDLEREIAGLCLQYGEDIVNRDICLVIETTDGDRIVGELNDVDVYRNLEDKIGLDFIAEKHGGDKDG